RDAFLVEEINQSVHIDHARHERYRDLRPVTRERYELVRQREPGPIGQKRLVLARDGNFLTAAQRGDRAVEIRCLLSFRLRHVNGRRNTRTGHADDRIGKIELLGKAARIEKCHDHWCVAVKEIELTGDLLAGAISGLPGQSPEIVIVDYEDGAAVDLPARDPKLQQGLNN